MEILMLVKGKQFPVQFRFVCGCYAYLYLLDTSRERWLMLMKCTHHSRVRQTMSWEVLRVVEGVVFQLVQWHRELVKKSSEAIKIKEPRKEPTKQQTNSPFRWPQIKQFFSPDLCGNIWLWNRMVYRAPTGFLLPPTPTPHTVWDNLWHFHCVA